MGLDYSAPWFSVRLYRVDAPEASLYLWSQEITPAFQAKFKVPAGVVNLPIAGTLSIDAESNAYAKVAVKFAVVGSQVPILLDSDLLVQDGNTRFDVQFGYLGPNLIMSDVITCQLQAPNFSLTREGADFQLLGYSAVGPGLTGSAMKGPFNKSRKQILELMAQGPDPKNPRPIVLDFATVKPGTSEFDRLNEEIAFDPGGRSDMAAIRDLASQCLLTFVFGQKNSLTGPQTVIRFLSQDARYGNQKAHKRFVYNLPGTGVLDGGIEAGSFPILSVTSDYKAAFLPQTLGVTTAKTDEKTKTAKVDVQFPEKAIPHASPGAKSGKQVSAGPKSSASTPNANAQNGGGKMEFGNKDLHPTLEGKSAALQMSAPMQAGLQLNIDSMGIPNLYVSEYVEVVGIGRRFDCVGSVLKVHHDWGAQTKTSFTLVAASFVTASARTAEKAKTDTTVNNPSTPGVESDLSGYAGYSSRREVNSKSGV